jgi:hypothetical protein
LIGAVFVNSAGARPIIVFLEEGTFEKNLAASPAAIALAATKGKGSDDLILTEVGTDETPNLALRLAGAKLGILDCARASGGSETLF